MSRHVSLAVTAGDPRGIGPELLAPAAGLALARDPDVSLTWIGPDGSLPPGQRAVSVGPAGSGDAGAGRASALSIERAVQMCLADEADGVVTGPVHKPSLHAAGWRVQGQTEMLRDLVRAERTGMVMCAESTSLGGPLRVLLATTHVPLRRVAQLLDTPLLVEATALLSGALARDWRIRDPRVALCALNPHASDGGLFGDEERTLYAPALTELAERGFAVTGPIPADTVFRRALDGEFDAVVAPYHDVGMAAFKTVSFGGGVNVTIGLPFVRTSPDHGTAFDIVGTGRADPSSMAEAILLAARLARGRAEGAHVE